MTSCYPHNQPGRGAITSATFLLKKLRPSRVSGLSEVIQLVSAETGFQLRSNWYCWSPTVNDSMYATPWAHTGAPETLLSLRASHRDSFGSHHPPPFSREKEDVDPFQKLTSSGQSEADMSIKGNGARQLKTGTMRQCPVHGSRPA